MTMKTLAEGPIMRERSTIPYSYVLRAALDENGEVREYVVHTKQQEFNSRGECIRVAYFCGHYFQAHDRDAAYLYWAQKVRDRIEHNINEGIAY